MLEELINQIKFLKKEEDRLKKQRLKLLKDNKVCPSCQQQYIERDGFCEPCGYGISLGYEGKGGW
jgi:predicted amidophosphoribosyltransferase